MTVCKHHQTIAITAVYARCYARATYEEIGSVHDRLKWRLPYRRKQHADGGMCCDIEELMAELAYPSTTPQCGVGPKPMLRKCSAVCEGNSSPKDLLGTSMRRS